jgi:hypothetical protein
MVGVESKRYLLWICADVSEMLREEDWVVGGGRGMLRLEGLELVRFVRVDLCREGEAWVLRLLRTWREVW